MSQSSDKLLELINNTVYPVVPFSPLNVELLDMQPATGNVAYNTRVTVRALANQGYQGERTLFYRRLALSVLGANITVALADAPTPQALLNKLNATLGSWLDLVDLQPFTMPAPAAGETLPLTLTAHVESFGWTGSLTLQIAGQTIPSQINISDATLVELP